MRRTDDWLCYRNATHPWACHVQRGHLIFSEVVRLECRSIAMVQIPHRLNLNLGSDLNLYLVARGGLVCLYRRG